MMQVKMVAFATMPRFQNVFHGMPLMPYTILQCKNPTLQKCLFTLDGCFHRLSCYNVVFGISMSETYFALGCRQYVCFSYIWLGNRDSIFSKASLCNMGIFYFIICPSKHRLGGLTLPTKIKHPRYNIRMYWTNFCQPTVRLKLNIL